MNYDKSTLSIRFDSEEEIKEIINDEYCVNEGCAIIGVRAVLVGKLEELLTE